MEKNNQHKSAIIGHEISFNGEKREKSLICYWLFVCKYFTNSISSFDKKEKKIIKGKELEAYL